MQKHFIKKSSISISLIFVLLITLVLAIFLPLLFTKEDDSYGFSGGKGTASSPYIIASKNDFIAMSNNVNNGLSYDGVYFLQTCDLTLGSFQPAGAAASTKTSSFQGNYDGGSFDISYTATPCTGGVGGLFAWTENATISNIKVTSCSIIGLPTNIGNWAVGGIVGYAENTNIINCFVQSNLTLSGSYQVSTSSSNPSIFALGGIVGRAVGSGTIEGCKRLGNISLTAIGSSFVGGIVGVVEHVASATNIGISIKNCIGQGEIKLNLSQENGVVGGIVGASRGTYSYQNSLDSETISQCFNNSKITATVTAGGVWVGGIIGYGSGYYEVIKNCLNVSNITATGASGKALYEGGIAGFVNNSTRVITCYNTGTITDNTGANSLTALGGISAYSGQIINCFNMGALSATTMTNVKAIVFTGSISYCYYGGNCTLTGQGNKFSDTQAKSQGFYTTVSNWNTSYPWDFRTVWTISSSYPTLQKIGIVVNPSKWISVYDNVWLGSGTSSSPYIIRTPEELAGLAFMVNYGSMDYAGKYFKQSANIDLSGLLWVPIGRHADGTHFSGVYDGGNYKISNMYFEDSTHVPGLFGVCYGAIKNVIIDSADLSINSVWGGSIVGLLETGGLVENCTSNAVIEASSQSSIVGGIVGHGWRSTIKNCHFTGSINSGADSVGGIVGQAYGEEAIIEQCTSSGVIKSASTNIGGIVGKLEVGASVSKCISKSNIKGAGNVGSLVGAVGTNGYVLNSAGYGNLSVTVSSGNLSGIIGCAGTVTTMTNCTFVGTANTVVHPFACNPSALTYSGCYTVINGVKYYTKGDFSGFTPTTYMNNGYPMQNELYSVAIGGYTSDQVITNLKNLGFELYF